MSHIGGQANFSPMLEAFKKLVDQSECPQAFQTGSVEEQYQYLGLRVDGPFIAKAVSNELSNRIAIAMEVSVGPENVTYDVFRNLTKIVIYDIILNGTSEKYLRISETLFQSLGKSGSYLPIAKWNNAIALVMAKVAAEEKPPVADLRTRYPRHVDTAKAIQRLIKEGCQIRWETGEVEVVSGMPTILDRLELLIQSISGPEVMRTIFTGPLKGQYNSTIQRYLFSSAPDVDLYGNNPRTPIAFLLNLAAKYPEERQFSPQELTVINAKWREAVLLSVAILKVQDVQPYSILEKVFRTTEKIVQGLYEMIIFDAAVRFPQSNPLLEMEMLPVLFDWIDRVSFQKKHGFTLDQFLAVASTVIDQSAGTWGPIVIYASTIGKRLRGQIDAITVPMILSKLSQPVSRINTGYREITDTERVNVYKRPLVQLSSTKFMLYDRSWTAMGFYEALLACAKEVSDAGKPTQKQNSDRKVGMALEQYVRKKLSEHGVVHYSGEFVDSNGKTAECDILIEGSQYLVIVEVKKKLLTAKARSGEMASVLLDLGSSLLQSQIQAGKTEILLRKSGAIEINNKSEKSTIGLKNRKLLRISVTHYDFDSLHDRLTAKQVLSAFVEGEFTLLTEAPPEIKAGFTKLLADAARWKEQYRTLSVLDPEFSEDPFFSTWFLSVGQLVLLLDGTSDSDGFITNLLKTLRISLSSNNFYFEYLKGSDPDNSGVRMVLYTPPRSSL
jgi:hypothetical protein